MIQIPITRLPHYQDPALPEYKTQDASGMDVCAAIASSQIILPSESCLIPTGIKLAVPSGYEIQIRPRSGLAAQHAVTVLNTPGTIDADYRGEIKVILINHHQTPFVVEPGMRIAQMVLQKIERISWIAVEALETTARAEGGFGHTGR